MVYKLRLREFVSWGARLPQRRVGSRRCEGARNRHCGKHRSACRIDIEYRLGAGLPPQNARRPCVTLHGRMTKGLLRCKGYIAHVANTYLRYKGCPNPDIPGTHGEIPALTAWNPRETPVQAPLVSPIDARGAPYQPLVNEIAQTDQRLAAKNMNLSQLMWSEICVITFVAQSISPTVRSHAHSPSAASSFRDCSRAASRRSMMRLPVSPCHEKKPRPVFAPRSPALTFSASSGLGPVPLSMSSNR